MGKILRRTFLIGTAAIAGGVAFGTYKLNAKYPNPLEDDLAEGEATFNPYVKITNDNQVTIMIPRAEMGQGVTTTLAALVAEELDVNMEDIAVEIAPASFAYYNSAMLADGAPLAHFNRSTTAEAMRAGMAGLGKVLGLQVTGGSSSITDAFDRMREAGCTARETLKLAAAERWNVPVADLKTETGTVIASNGDSLTYGDLAQLAAKLSAPSDISLKSKADWSILGKPVPRKDMRAKCTGAPIFGIDVDLPDMIYATIKMNPYLGGSMVSFDATEAKKVRDVIDVIDMSGPSEEAFGGGFAVLANNTWAAFKAAEAVKVEWGQGPYPATTSGIMDVIAKALNEGDGDNLRDDGDVDIAFADAPRTNIIEAQYEVPYLAHGAIEPMNATAQLSNGELHIWTGTQAPTLIRDDCAAEVGLDRENVFIHSTYLGGGFGRRGEVDFARYAARLAKSTDGKPVHLVWSREEDMTHDTYRPASMSKWRARLDDAGVPVAIDARISTPSVIGSVMTRTFPSMPTAGPDNTISQGAFDQPYGVKDYRVSGIKAPVDIPVGFWRSVGNSYNGFYHESFIDECAAKTGMDPVDLRRKLMADYPTALGVVEKLAEISNWTEPKKANRAKGMAFTLSFGCWTGIAVEIAQRDDGIKIENVWIAADVGEALDPAIVKAQLQSAAIFGLSSAMDEEITFEDGRVQQTNFDTFNAMRMPQCPNFEIAILETAEHRSGIGEPGTPPSIPALANAVYALTGKRVRSLPLSKEVEFTTYA